MKAAKSKKRRVFKGRRAKDGGAWAQALPEKTRRNISIEDKLKVLAFYEEKEKEKAEAIRVLSEPRAKKATPEARAADREKRIKAKKTKKLNLQKLCEKNFPLIVGKSWVCKWKTIAARECWRDLPQPVRSRTSCATNEWRLKIGGVKAKGRPQGGRVPMALQRELDILMAECAVGMSNVSERREIVAVESIVPRLNCLM